MALHDGEGRDAQNPRTRRIFDPIVLFNLILAAATVALAVIAVLQWQILQRTEQTSRAGERALVYMQDIDIQSLKPSGQGWQITPNLINNGTTAATGVVDAIVCSFGDIQNTVQKKTPSFVGPRQITDLGYCRVTSDEIRRSQNNIKIGGIIFYVDAFHNSHQSLFCRNIVFQGEPSGSNPTSL